MFLLHLRVPKRRCGSVAALEGALDPVSTVMTIALLLAFVAVMTAMHTPVATATSSAVLLTATTISALRQRRAISSVLP